MEEHQKHIDDILREALGNYTETPPPAAWEAVERRLPEQRRRRPFSWWGWLVLLLITGTSVFLTGQYFNSRSGRDTVPEAIAPAPTGTAGPTIAEDPSSQSTPPDDAPAASSDAANVPTEPTPPATVATPAPHEPAPGTSTNTTGSSTSRPRPPASRPAPSSATDPAAGATAPANRRNTAATSPNAGAPPAAASEGHQTEMAPVHAAGTSPAPGKDGSSATQLPGRNRQATTAPATLPPVASRSKAAANAPAGAKSRQPETVTPRSVPPVTRQHQETTPAPAMARNDARPRVETNTDPAPGKNAPVTAPAPAPNSAVTKNAPRTATRPDKTTLTPPAKEQPSAPAAGREPVAPTRNAATPPGSPETGASKADKVAPSTASRQEDEVDDADEEEDEPDAEEASDSEDSQSELPYTMNSHNRKFRISAEAGVRTGYELGFGSVKADKAVGSAWLRLLFGERWSVGISPSYKWGSVSRTGLLDPQTYYQINSYTADSTWLGVDSFGNPTAVYYSFREDYDSLRISYQLSRQIWEVELPLLIGYQVAPALYFFAGPTFTFGNKLTINENRELLRHVVRTDSAFFNAPLQQPPAPGAYPNPFAHTGRPTSSLPGTFTNADNNPLRIGYTAGAAVNINRFQIGASVQQHLSGYRQIPNADVRNIYRRPYFRLTVGYRLLLPKKWGSPEP